MSGIKLNSRGRCPQCGRFIKRGLLNFIQHDAICPEINVLIFSKEYSGIVKRKHTCSKHLNIQNDRRKTTLDRNSRMENNR